MSFLVNHIYFLQGIFFSSVRCLACPVHLLGYYEVKWMHELYVKMLWMMQNTVCHIILIVLWFSLHFGPCFNINICYIMEWGHRFLVMQRKIFWLRGYHRLTHELNDFFIFHYHQKCLVHPVFLTQMANNTWNESSTHLPCYRLFMQ